MKKLISKNIIFEDLNIEIWEENGKFQKKSWFDSASENKPIYTEMEQIIEFIPKIIYISKI